MQSYLSRWSLQWSVRWCHWLYQKHVAIEAKVSWMKSENIEQHFVDFPACTCSNHHRSIRGARAHKFRFSREKKLHSLIDSIFDWVVDAAMLSHYSISFRRRCDEVARTNRTSENKSFIELVGFGIWSRKKTSYTRMISRIGIAFIELAPLRFDDFMRCVCDRTSDDWSWQKLPRRF